ncbi:MAG: amino acid adenylation domain-containing protein [Candidatus Eremiobacteraeota bacterium]|nr:amino acid adenylation domain-containing protein [Candidatus Eremiobacteraeota bacterium]
MSKERDEREARLVERLERLSPDERAFVRARLRAARTSRTGDEIPRRDAAAAAPLSFEQEVLWRIEQTIPDRSTYNVPRAMRIRGALDVERVRAALDALVVRHDVLRTRFVERSGAPAALPMPPRPVALERFRVAATEPAEREAELADTLRGAASRPFDLGGDPLLRAALVDIDEHDHALLLVWHHIASDAAAGDILLREFAALYAGASLPELPLRYADFATWQRARLTADRKEALLAYWRPQLAQATPRLTLPVGAPHSGAPTFEGARRSFVLPSELADAVTSLARAQGTTPFIALLAAFATLLQRYSGEPDVVVGTVLTGRDRPELENIVGYFANVLPLRTSFAGEPTFIDVLRRVRETYLDAHEHADLPFESLMLATRGGAGAPTMPVMFTTLRGEGSTPPLPCLAVEAIAIDRKVAKFELTVAAGVVAAGLSLAFEYRTDLFDEATIERVCGHYRTLLEAAVAAPTTRVAMLPLLTADERTELERWNDTSVPAAHETLADLVERAVAGSPSEPAVVCGDRQLSFAQLNELADRLALRLARSGVGPDVLVGVYMRREPEMIVALLAVAKAGGAYLPLDPAYPVPRIAFMLRDAGVAVCLTQPQLAAALAALPLETIALGSDGRAAGDRGSDPVPLPRTATAESLAYVIYTSGSTGAPKGAMIRQRGLVNYLRWCTQAYDVAAGIGAPVHSSISFDLTVTSMWAPLVAGRTAFLVPDDGIEALAHVLRSRRNFSLIKCTPAHLEALRLELADDDVAGLCRLFVIGGEALFGETIAWWQRHAPRTIYVNEYGPTETVGGCAVEFVRGEDRMSGAVPIGRPIAATQLHVLDASGQLLPVGVAGELFIAGDGVAAGYLGRPELTAERFVPDSFSGTPNARMYRSGDVVRRRADGVLDYLGRADDQVKLRGYRIEPGEIQAALASHPSVAAAAAILRDDVAAGPALIAYYVLHPAATATNADLRAHVRERLPAYMVPTYFQELGALPLTGNGKVDRAALPPPDTTAAAATRPVAPRTPLEREIAERIGALLGGAPPGVHDDFFEIGGHSLSAMRLLAAVTTAYRVRISLHDFFTAPTVAALAERVAVARAAAAPPESRYGGRRAGRGEPVPLTAGQTLLWLQEQSAPGLAVYNVPLVFAVTGALDAVALGRALDAIVARHAALRLQFIEQDGEPRQIAVSPYHVELANVDLRGCVSSTQTAAVAERHLIDAACAPFDLASGRLLRAALLRLEDEAWRFLIVVHHLVFDGWSSAILVDELTTLHAAFRRGGEPELPALLLTFSDYAVAEQQSLAAGRLDALRSYWRERLRAAPTSLGLPAGRSGAAEGPFAGATIVSTLPPSLATALLTLSQANGATLFMTLVAAFTTLLGRWTGTEDIVIGAPVAGRTQPETSGLIGNFASVVALRADLSADPTFLELLECTRRSTVEAFDHADVPVETLISNGRAAGAGLFEAVLVLQDDAPPEYRLGDARLAPLPLERGVSAFPLTLTFARQAGGLRASLRYRSALFDAATMERTLERLRLLLESIVANAHRHLSELPLLAPHERQFLVERCNATARPYPTDLTLVDLLTAQAARTPSAVALVWETQAGAVASFTYAELHARAGALARQLRACGVGPHVGVGICAERGPELVVATLAVLEAGGYYVPFDPDYPEDRLGFMLQDSAAAILLAQAHLAEKLPHGDAVVVILDDAGIVAPMSAESVARKATPRDPAYMIYTSGSTGKPKGALNAHAGIVNRLLWMNERWPLGPDDVVLQKTPYSFDVSVWELFWPLIAGARLVMARPGGHRDPFYLVEAIERHGVTTVHFVPSMLRAFLADGGAGRCTSLRRVMCSGEALAPELVPAFHAQLGAELHNLYGPTEAAVDVTHWAIPRDWTEPVVPIGRPIANTQTYILDRHGEPVPLGIAGELFIGGVQVGLGYHRRPELTAERFVVDPFSGAAGARLYRTGDRARYRVDGTIEYLGRLDDQVKLRGFRIELGEIEATLGAHPLVRNCAVAVHAAAHADGELVAYFVAERAAAGGSGAPSPSSLRAYLRERLPDAMVPNFFVQLEALPLGPSGKLDRKALPPPNADATRSRSSPFIAPRSATESVLANIFASVLAVPAPTLGIDDDFFELGGHSLLAMSAVAQAGTVLRSRASVGNFFRQPTVRGFAASLTAAEGTPGRTEAVARAVQALAAMTPEERQRRKAALQNA